MEILRPQSRAHMLRLLLILGLMVSPTSAGLLDDLGLSRVCAGVTTAFNLPECISQFVKAINISTTVFVKVNGTTVADTNNDRILCCALNELQACVVKKIGTTCGTDAEKKAKSIVKVIITSGKYLTKKLADKGQLTHLSCDNDWDLAFFRKESPLCWSVENLTALMVLLFLFALSCCCNVYCGRCRCRSKPRPVPIVFPCTVSGNVRPPSSIPYQQLNNDTQV